jgi:hypothetical protein
MFFLTVHYFHSFVPISQQARQAVVLGHLSLNIFLWFRLPLISKFAMSGTIFFVVTRLMLMIFMSKLA